MNATKWFLSILILFLLVACGENNKRTNVLNVKQVLNKPNNYLNKNISIHGMVNKVNEDKNIFSVISEKEFSECGLGECNVNEQLPVRFQGKLPGLGEKVEIAGIVKKNEKGFIYEAESVKIIKNL